MFHLLTHGCGLVDLEKKEAASAFMKYQGSDCNLEAVRAVILLPQNNAGDVGEKLNTAHRQEKAKSQKIFMPVLQNTRFLTRQCLAFRGDVDDVNGNFVQLLHLHGQDHERVASLAKRTNKYRSTD